MGRIGRQAEALRQQAGAVEADAVHVNDILARPPSHMHAVASPWEGAASVVFLAAQQEYR
jgi:uncharacterized protein YukE